MSPRGKKKTTFAKLSREARLRDRREHKRARKEARRQAPAPALHPTLVDTHEGPAREDSTGADGEAR